MSRARLAGRLARREVVRRPGRTLLVMLLVAIPIAGMTTAATLVRTGHQTPADRWFADFGNADAVAYLGDETAEKTAAQIDAFESALPEGSRMVVDIQTYVGFRGDGGGRRYGALISLDLADPIQGGRYRLGAGSLPRSGFEVALPSRMAERLAVGVGDEIDVRGLDHPLEVVGFVEQAACFDCDEVYAAPPADTSIPFNPSNNHRALVELGKPLYFEQVNVLAAKAAGGFETLDSRIGFDNGSGTRNGIAWTLVIGAVCLAVVGIVISAAFAVGARRQLQTIGQLGANGSPASTQRATLALQGTFSGILGSLLGFAIAAVGLNIARNLIELKVMGRRIDSYTAVPLDLVLIAAVGIGAATVAALVPAWSVTRVPVLSAIAGRRPLGRVRHSVTLAGMLATACGLGLLAVATVGSGSGQDGSLWALIAIAGGLGVLFGACALTPQIISQLEPLATHTRGVVRLAARSLTRQRTRSGAVVAAVAAAGALAIGGVALVRSADFGMNEGARLPNDVALVVTSQQTSGNVAPDPEVVADVASVLPDATQMHTFSTVDRLVVGSSGGELTDGSFCCFTSSQGGPPSDAGVELGALVVDPELAETLDLPDEVRGLLRTKGAVLVNSYDSGRVAVTITLPGGDVVDTMVVPSNRRTIDESLLVSDELITEFGLATRPGPVVFDNPVALTDDDRFALQDVLNPVTFNATDPIVPIDGARFSYVDVDYPTTGPSPLAVELALSGLAVAFSLLVVTIGLALSAAETRDERDVLTIVGAPPSTLARVSASKAWLLGLVGFALAVPVGFLPVVVFIAADNGDNPLIFPTSLVATLVLVVPVVVGLCAWVGSAIAQRLRPVTVSRLAFE